MLYRMAEDAGTQCYHHGRFKVAGGVLPDAITAYRTYGSPENPCIVFPTCYGAKMRVGSELNVWLYVRRAYVLIIPNCPGQDYMIGTSKVRRNDQWSTDLLLKSSCDNSR